MASEPRDIEAFIRATAPFDRLDAEQIAPIARAVMVRYFRGGETILEAGSHNDWLYIVRSGAVELRLAGEELTARIGSGGIFAFPSLLRGGEVRNEARAIEDTLVYLLPAAEFHRLREASARIRQFFAESEGERIGNAVRELKLKRSGILEETPIGALVRHRTTVSCGPRTSIEDAARLMSHRDVSTLAICDDDGHLQGIFTDKDLRNRVVAMGHGLDRPVSEVMTPNPRTLPESASISEAMAIMAAGGFRHIPTIAPDGELGAILSATDILAHLGDSAIDTGMLVAKAAEPQALIAAARRIPEGFARMQAGGFHADHTMRFTSALGEAVHRRAAELAEAELGPPPVPYALMVFGSLARGEQLVGSDQDNGLVIDDAVDDAGRRYFEALGTRISDLLHQAGFVYCKGGIMAKNAEQRLTASEWRTRYARWIHDPDEDRILRATIFFDMRAVHGKVDLEHSVRSEVLAQARANPLFLSYLARDAQRSRIPLGIFRNLVLEKAADGHKVFDAKAQAILPVIDIARTFALAEGIDAVGTLERLEALAGSGKMARGDAESLKDAFLLVNELRISHQADQIRSGTEPDNEIAPDALSPLERDYLKDAFSVIRAGLESLRRNLAGGIA
ncbi:MAG: cyclic nucleotide-binding protein [Actinobacteria bacterium]|nr:cyclic nucleotide-binding protein [Actinomycetota bacterium]